MTKVATAKTYTTSEIAARLKADLPSWGYQDGALTRTFKTGDWKATLMLVTTIGHLAEAAWHHPDLAVSYSSVGVRLNTHDAGGITDKDFALAAKIEEVIQWQPAREGKGLDGAPASAGYVVYG